MMATLSPGTRHPSPDTHLALAFFTLAWRWGENTDRSKGSMLVSREEIMEEILVENWSLESRDTRRVCMK